MALVLRLSLYCLVMFRDPHNSFLSTCNANFVSVFFASAAPIFQILALSHMSHVSFIVRMVNLHMMFQILLLLFQYHLTFNCYLLNRQRLYEITTLFI